MLAATGYSVVKTSRLQHLLDSSPKFLQRQRYLFSHHPSKELSPPAAAFAPQRRADSDDYSICRRLLDYYHRASQNPQEAKQDVWSCLESGHHAEFLALLKTNDEVRLAEHLSNFWMHNIAYGVTQADNYDKLVKSVHLRDQMAILAYDRLVCLAEMLGCCYLENPEQGRFDENIYIGLQDLMGRIQEKVGFVLSPPSVAGGLYGLEIPSGGLLHVRDIEAIEASQRIAKILDKTKMPRVAEIGAGLGKVAYWSTRAGITDYTIFDIPYMGVMSGYCLLKSFPASAISFWGEAEDSIHQGIKIRPYWAIHQIEGRPYNLVLNQDSMPEIDDVIVQEYLATISCISEFFLSINQEGKERAWAYEKPQSPVSFTAANSGKFREIYRFKYWTREGYLEELFEPIKFHESTKGTS